MPDFSFIAVLTTDPQSVQGLLLLFLALAIGHVIADFPLQGQFIADTKNRNNDISQYFQNSPPPCLWIHTLTAHSLIHGAAVWLITGSAVLAVIEICLHWVIDYVKCEGWTGFNTDQILHYVCKLVYAMAIYLGMRWV